MLILTRRTGESLRIGDDVEVTLMPMRTCEPFTAITVTSTSRRPAMSPSIARKSRNANSANENLRRNSSVVNHGRPPP